MGDSPSKEFIVSSRASVLSSYISEIFRVNCTPSARVRRTSSAGNFFTSCWIKSILIMFVKLLFIEANTDSHPIVDAIPKKYFNARILGSALS